MIVKEPAVVLSEVDIGGRSGCEELWDGWGQVCYIHLESVVKSDKVIGIRENIAMIAGDLIRVNQRPNPKIRIQVDVFQGVIGLQ